MGAWIEIIPSIGNSWKRPVAPLVGAWIEIIILHHGFQCFYVAPLVGAWIEMCRHLLVPISLLSLPSWERGLKLLLLQTVITLKRSLPSWERGLKFTIIEKINHCIPQVAPLVGAWIEMLSVFFSVVSLVVAPLVGAWIEIVVRTGDGVMVWSLPSWERGLKW